MHILRRAILVFLGGAAVSVRARAEPGRPMTDIQTLGRTVFRDYTTDGVPSSGANLPAKADIRALFDAIEAQKATARDTLADAKALTTRPDTLIIKGKAAAYDGWGGIFVWVAADATTADDALVIQCTAGAAGRYKRLYDGALNVRWFGAKCDSDPTGAAGTDDTVAINAALAAVPATGGAVLLPGWSKITGALSVTRSNFEFAGLSPWGSGLVTASAVADIFTANSALQNVVFRDFGIWSTVTKSAGNVFTAPRATRFKFLRVVIDRTRVQTDGARLWRILEMNGCDNVTVENCTFAGAQHTAIRVYGDSTYNSELRIGGDTRIALNDIGVHCAGNFGGLYLDDVSIDANGKNVVVDQSVVATINREIFLSSECNIDVCSDTGLEIGADGAAYVEISGTWISSAGRYGAPAGNQTNLYVNATNAALLLVINHTRLYNATGAGAYFGGGNIECSGVQCTDNGTYGIDVGANVVEFNAVGGRLGGNNVSGDMRLDAGVAAYNIQGVSFLSTIKLVNILVLSSAKFLETCPGIAQEGTWTPVIAGSITAGTQAYTTQWGYWSRVGRKVTLYGRIVLSTFDAATAGNMQIGGLPFPARTLTDAVFSGTVGSAAFIAHGTDFQQFGVRVSSGASFIDLLDFGKEASAATSTVAVAAMSNTSAISFELSYLI